MVTTMISMGVRGRPVDRVLLGFLDEVIPFLWLRAFGPKLAGSGI